MTVAVDSSKSRYSGDGANDTFAIGFAFITAATHVKVYIRDETNPLAITETLKTEGVDFDFDGPPEVNVIFKAGKIPTADQKVIIIRVGTLSQATDYIANDPFPADSHEKALDKALYLLQEVYERSSRALLFPVTTALSWFSFPEPQASALVGWNDGETALENYLPENLVFTEVRKGTTALVTNDLSKSPVFTDPFAAGATYVVIAQLMNETDANPDFQPVTITSRSVTGFTAKWNAPIPNNNYKLSWIAVRLT